MIHPWPYLEAMPLAPVFAVFSCCRSLSGWQVLRHVVPIIAPGLVGIGLFGFTLTHDEVARTSQSVGALNTLPIELEAMQTNATTPVIYGPRAMTTGLTPLVIGAALAHPIGGAPAARAAYRRS